MTLFGASGYPFGSYNMLVYDLKFYESGKLVRHYIPCYNKSNFKPGLYDVVNNDFYTNVGTGDFEMGPEI